MKCSYSKCEEEAIGYFTGSNWGLSFCETHKQGKLKFPYEIEVLRDRIQHNIKLIAKIKEDADKTIGKLLTEINELLKRAK